MVIKQLCHFTPMKSTSFRTVSLETLFNSDVDRFSLHKDLSMNLSSGFLSSIKRYGLFHPPVVMKTAKGYQLICGRKRIQSLLEIGSAPSPLCRVVNISGPSELLTTIFEDQRLSGPLSVIMIARLLKLTETLIPQGSRKALIEQLDIGSYGQLKRLLPLLNLEQPIRDAIHRGSISEKVGLILCSIAPEDRLFLCHLFLELSLNKNKQKRLLDMCQILIAQKRGTYKKLFQNDFRDFLPENIGSNIPQTSGNLLKYLYEASHPLSTHAEKVFNDRKNDLGLPASCSVSHSPAFEKDKVTLSIEFDNLDEMTRIWRTIKHQLK